MGMASACQIYQKFADAVLYIMYNTARDMFYINGKLCIFHYLDDFFGGHPNGVTAMQQFSHVYQWFAKLGIPTQPNKLRYPSMTQIILGWLYNTITMTVSLPADKVEKYIAILRYLKRNGTATKKKLEQVVGFLTHASVAIYPAKAFIRRLEQSLHLELYNYNDKIYLSDYVLADIDWWISALKHLNGIPLSWLVPSKRGHDIQLWCDAATKFGLGGCTDQKQAFQIMNVCYIA